MDIVTLLIALSSLLVAGIALYATLQRNKNLEVFLEHNSGKDLGKELRKHFERQKELKLRADEIAKTQSALDSLQQEAIQKVGLVRYNPYRNTGGDQSFSLCLLNYKDDGILLTAIHGREATRVYSKTIKQRSATHQLSNEEAAALEAAINN